MEIIMYSKPHCPYCVKAKELLDQKEIEFTEIDIHDEEKKKEMVQRSGRMTVPQIFIDEEHIGGYTELKELDEKKGLDKNLPFKEAPCNETSQKQD